MMDFALVEDQIEQAYSTPELNVIMRNHLRSFIRRYPDPFLLKKLDIAALSRVSIPRKQMVRALSVVACDADLMKNWLAGLSARARQALNLAAWAGTMSASELEASIGGSVLETGRGKESAKRLKREFPLFQHRVFRSFWGAEGNTDHIELPSLIARTLRASFPEPQDLRMAGEQDPPEGMTIFRDDEKGAKTIPFISRFVEQGELELTRQGLPSSRSLLRLRDASGLVEFYDKKQPSELSCLRMRMMLEILLNVETGSEPSADITFLRELVDSYLKPGRFPHDWFFSHVKGMIHCRDNLNDRLHTRYWKLLENLPLNRWMTIDGINRFVRVSSLDLSPVSLRCADRYLYVTTEWKGWGNKKRYLVPRLYQDFLLIPLLKAFLFLYASLGLLDLAYRSPQDTRKNGAGKSYLTVFDGLSAVRLTDLGAVLTGRKSWSGDGGEPDPLTYELDTKRLHITCNREDPIADISMERFAQKISPRRYRVDEGAFLRSCVNAAELQLKINTFSEETGCAFPPVWERFFGRLVQRADVLQPVEDMLVFKLAVKHPDDLETIGSDRVLRQIVIKAEGRYVLVKKDKAGLLKNRLAELGYLM